MKDIIFTSNSKCAGAGADEWSLANCSTGSTPSQAMFFPPIGTFPPIFHEFLTPCDQYRSGKKVRLCIIQYRVVSPLEAIKMSQN